MASSYSTSLKLELIGNGDQSGVWGNTTNNNLGVLIEQAITGVQTITMADSNYTLSNLNGSIDEARNAVLVITGTNSAVRQIIAPLVNKLYTIFNNTTGGYSITVGGASGSLVSIANGVTALVYCDGTNFYTGFSGVTNNFNVPGNLTAFGIADTGSLSVTNNATIGGNLTVSGTITGSGITGRIIQVVQSTFTSAPSTTTSGSFQATGHTGTITPTSTSSKILVQVYASCATSTGNDSALTIYRGATNLAGSSTTALTSFYSISGGEMGVPVSMSFYDSPATASSTTYQVYYATNGGTTITYNKPAGNLAFGQTAVMTLTEIL